MVEQPDLEAGIGNDELDPIVLASFCGLAVVVKVVNIDYRPDFFIAICGDIPFILFLQLACKIRELFRTFVLLLVVDDNVIYGLELLEILSFGNSSASYDKITLLRALWKRADLRPCAGTPRFFAISHRLHS